MGWFTCIFPFRLPTECAEDIGALVVAVKDRRRAIPSNGIGYGALQTLGGEAQYPSPEVVFNYLGQVSEDESYPDFKMADVDVEVLYRHGPTNDWT